MKYPEIYRCIQPSCGFDLHFIPELIFAFVIIFFSYWKMQYHIKIFINTFLHYNVIILIQEKQYIFYCIIILEQILLQYIFYIKISYAIHRLGFIYHTRYIKMNCKTENDFRGFQKLFICINILI